MGFTEIITGLLGGFIGGALVAFVQYFLNKKREIELSLNKITEDKYRSLLVFMACSLDIKKRRYFSLNEQTQNKTSQDYLNQIKEYYYHSLLYSSCGVIIKLKQFIETPNLENYIKVAIEMRKELWNKATKLEANDIILN